MFWETKKINLPVNSASRWIKIEIDHSLMDGRTTEMGRSAASFLITSSARALVNVYVLGQVSTRLWITWINKIYFFQTQTRVVWKKIETGQTDRAIAGLHGTGNLVIDQVLIFLLQVNIPKDHLSSLILLKK